MARLLDLLAVHESYFFREKEQLTLVARTLLAEARAERPQAVLRVWSAGCAAGEEPYSLVILMEESRLWQKGAFEILGTDLSASCLERARQGVYTTGALRETSNSRRSRWFEDWRHDVRLREPVHRRVHFQRLNLYQDAPCSWMGRFDVILCRNVLLYMDVEARQRVVETLHERLQPGGWLVLGRSETLLNLSTALQAVERSGEMLYRRFPGGRS